jgi:hypothetical protein
MPGLKTMFGLGLLVALTLPVNDAAAQEGSWCAYTGGRYSYQNCGYYSLRQCLEATSGVGGACMPNPRGGYSMEDRRGGYYDDPPPRRRVRPSY